MQQELEALKAEKAAAVAKADKLQKAAIDNAAKPAIEAGAKTNQKASKNSFSPEIMNQLTNFVKHLKQNR